MLTTQNLLLFLSVLLSGLVAGLFYSYSCSVNPGLGALDDLGYLKAMQSINRAILNPVFFAGFMGTLLVLVITTCYSFMHDRRGSFYYVAAALCVYAIAVFGVTLFANVPLNNALDAFDLEAAGRSELAEQRIKFEGPWNRYHAIRSIAAVISFVLTIIALFRCKLK